MKKTKRRALYIIAALLGVLFILACLAGFAACGGDKCADGHTWDDGEVTTEATCTETGVKTYTCTVCGETNTVTIEALGHNWVSGTAVDATCTTGGYTPQTCSRCEATQNINETDALGHVLTGTYTPAVIDSNNPSNPIVTTEGYWTYACGQCSATIDLEKDPVASVTLTVTDEESLAAAAAWTDVSGVVPTAVVDTYDGTTETSAGIALSATLTVSSAIVLDLNGETITTGTNLTTAMDTIKVASTGSLTITDSSSDGMGSIKNTYKSGEGESSTSTDNAAAIHSEGAVVIEGGTIESSSVGIRAEAGTVTINGGTVTSSGYYAIWESKGEVTVTIEGGAVTGSNGIFVAGDSKEGYETYQSGAKTTLIVNGGTVTASGDSAISANGLANKDTVYIEINGGEIATTAGVVLENDAVKTSYPAIYLPNGNLKITGGTITGSTAVEVRGGAAAISGGTLKAGYYDTDGNLVTGNDAAPSGNGAKTYGYAFSVYPYGKVNRSSENGFDNTVDVTISGGTFEGDIYVAAQSQNKTNDNYWTVVLNGEDSAKQSASYVVDISGVDMTCTEVTENSQTVAYVFSNAEGGGD